MKHRKLSLGARFGLYVASFLLAAILFVSTFAAGILFSIHSVVTEENIQNVVEQSDLTDALAEPISEMLYESLKTETEDGESISREEMQEIFEESDLVDFITEKTTLLITDFVAGESNTILKKNEIIKLLDNNADIIEEISGQRLTEEEQEEIADAFFDNEIINTMAKDGLQGVLDSMAESPADFLPVESLKPSELNTLKSTMETVNTVIFTIRDLSSAKSLVLCCVVSLVLIAAIILINALQLPVGFRRASYPIIMVGMTAIPLLLTQAPLTLWDNIPGFEYVQSIVSPFATIYGVILGVGLALLISGIVLAIIKKVSCKAESSPVAPVAAPAPVAPVTAPAPVVVPVPEEPIAVTEEPAVFEEPVATAEETVS